MQYPDSAKYLYSLAKRARKYYLGLTIISQDVEDFLNSDQGRAIINNSSIQILLKQSPAAVEKLAQVFHLTEGEKFSLLESDVGEGLFFAGASHVAIKIIASFAEDQIITTDPKELLAQKEEEAAQNAVAGEAISADTQSDPEMPADIIPQIPTQQAPVASAPVAQVQPVQPPAPIQTQPIPPATSAPTPTPAPIPAPAPGNPVNINTLQ